MPAKTDSMTRACCPDCRLGLWLRERDEDGHVAYEDKVWRVEDRGTVDLYVKAPHLPSGRTEILGNSAGPGCGPDGAAHGTVECPNCGLMDVDGLRAAFERRLHARG